MLGEAATQGEQGKKRLPQPLVSIHNCERFPDIRQLMVQPAYSMVPLGSGGMGDRPRFPLSREQAELGHRRSRERNSYDRVPGQEAEEELGNPYTPRMNFFREK